MDKHDVSYITILKITLPAPFYFMYDFIVLFVGISLIIIRKNVEYIIQVIH
jgi:hypothetical protein